MSGSAGDLRVRVGVDGVQAAEAEFARLESRLKTTAGAQKQYEQEVALIQRAQERGTVSTERASQALEEVRRRYEGATQPASRFAGVLGEAENAAAGFAGRLGPIGGAVSAMGPAGLAAAAGIGALGAALVPIARAGDEMVASLGRIRSATGSIEAAREVYDQLYRLSLQTGQSVSETAGQFQRFAIASREIGATNSQAIALVSTLQKAAIVGGSSAQEAASAAMQLGQALASGVLQGEELRSLLENMPNLAVALAQELGVGVGQLRAMGAEGALTADTVMPALLRASEKVNEEYEEMPVTMSRAFDTLQIAAGNFLAKLSEALQVSQTMSAVFQSMGGWLDRQSTNLFPDARARARSSADESQSRIRQLELEIGRLENTGPSVSNRIGGYQRNAQIAGAKAAGGDLIEDLKTQLAAEREVYAQHQRTLNMMLLAEGESARDESEEADTRAAANRRERSVTAIRELRGDLDKSVKIREEFAEQQKTISEALQRGAINEADAHKLTAQAIKARDEALKGLNKTGGSRKKELTAAEIDARDVAAMIVAQNKEYDKYQRDKAAEDQRAAEKAEADHKRELERRQQLSDRITDDIVRYSADAFADMFTETGLSWDKMWRNMQRTAVAILARVAAEAVIRPIISPIVSDNLGTFTGLGGYGTRASGVAAAGGSAAGGLGGLTQYTDGIGSVGKLFLGGNSAVNTGWGWLDRGLNSTAYSIGGAADTATMGLVSTDPNVLAGANSGINVSYGQMAAGGLSVAGGLYGIYSGIQQGGAKGWATSGSGAAATAGGAATLMGGAAAGGAIGAVATVAPYVAAVLAIASMFLEGQKPSDMTGAYRMTLDTGYTSELGLEGDRYSGPNREEARSIAQQIASLGEVLRTATGVSSTPYAFEVGVGNRDGIRLLGNGRTRNYTRDEAGSQQLMADAAADMIASMRHAMTSEMQGIVDRSGSDTTTLLGNIDWYNNTYKRLTETGDDALGAFDQQMQALAQTFDAARDKAWRLGLSEDGLIAKRAEAEAALVKQQRDWYSTGFDQLRIRQMNAAGVVDPAALLDIALTQFNASASAERTGLIQSLKDYGIAEGSQAYNDRLSYYDQTAALERNSVVVGVNDNVAGQRRGYWQSYRQAEGRDYINSIEGVRTDYTANQAGLRALGMDPEGLYWAQLRAQMDQLDAAQLQDVASSFRGLDDAAADLATQMLASGNAASRAAQAQEEATRAQQRASATSSATGVISSLADYASALRTSDASPLSQQSQFALAQSQFEQMVNAAVGGDAASIRRLQSAGDTYLSAGRSLFGSTGSYNSVFNRVQDALGQVGAMEADMLTNAFLAESLQDQTVTLVEELQRLRGEVAALRREQAQAALRPAA